MVEAFLAKTHREQPKAPMRLAEVQVGSLSQTDDTRFVQKTFQTSNILRINSTFNHHRYIYLLERQDYREKDRERDERDIPLVSSVPKWLLWLGLGQGQRQGSGISPMMSTGV